MASNPTNTEHVRQRIKDEAASARNKDLGAGTKLASKEPHPAGPVQHSGLKQAFLLLSFFFFFNFSCICIHGTQMLGAPLYFVNKDYYYAWMGFTKQQFGLFINALTHWFSPTTIRVSGDASVKGELVQTANGVLKTKFPERLVLMANHQIYTDWLYLWWISYTSRMHGHLFIILKESLKYIPVIGPGMMFYGFVFLSRKWVTDKPRLQHSLNKLKTAHSGPMSGSSGLDPAWLLIFPEGTNLSLNGRNASRKWAEKTGLEDMKHQLLPRSTGLQFCLQGLKGTIEWVYDCTIAYEGVPRGEYGQDIFSLWSMYFQGRIPKSVNMYWRRFHVSSIPIDGSSTEFESWLRARWTEKDELLEGYMLTGRFPSAEKDSFIETEVRQDNPLEVLLIFAPMMALSLLVWLLHRSELL